MCDRCVVWGGEVWHVKKKGYYERTSRLHREVWKAANGPIPKGHDVHHKNEDPLDNRIENLELLTKSEHSALHAEQHLGPVREKAWAASKLARDRNREARKQRILKCTVCGGDYTSGSRHPTKYCSSACIEKARSGAFAGEGRRCEYCGIAYTATRRVQRYCTKRCNNLAAEARIGKQETRKISCAACGTEFESARSNARFCGRPCALRFHSDNKFRKKVSEAG